MIEKIKIYAAAALLLVALTVIAYCKVHHAGYESGRADATADCAGRIGKLDGKGSDLCAVAIRGVIAQAETDRARFEAQQQAAQQAHEQAQADALATYKKELQDAKTAADRTIADLRARNERVRDAWQCPAVPAAAVQTTAAGGPGSDAAADGQQRIALDIFRAVAPIVQRQDAQIKALQAIVKEDRQ